MARKRKKTDEQTVERRPPDGPRVFDTGLYARLSVLDNGKPDGDSLETQISLMEEYVSRRPELRRAGLYQDNGYTGTNFRRPAWDALLRDVEAGRISCIVVKDLSRLGRNYLETGGFLEKECPRLGVRFISINDGYDSARLDSSEELTAALKNIINDCYARDISRKSCSALAVKRQNGEYVGSYAPYGYRKDPANKNHLLIDPAAAPVVRQIYEWRASGAGFGTITRRLNEQGIPSPGRYRFEQGIMTNNTRKGSGLLWNRHVLSDMLKNPVYLGHLAQGKCRAALYRGIPAHTVPQEEWDMAYHAHEAILTEELFEAVRQVNERQSAAYFANQGKYSHLPKESNPYREKLVCAGCGARLKLCRSLAQNRSRGYYSYLCPTYEEHRELGCTKKSIRSSELDAAVLSALKIQTELFLDAEQVLSRLAEMRRSAPAEDRRSSRREAAERQLARKEALSAALYSDWRDGILSYEEYRYAKAQYARELAELKQRLNELRSDDGNVPERTDMAARWAEKLRAYQNAERVTKELVDALISCVRLDGGGEVSVRFSFGKEQELLEREIKRLREGAA